MENNRVYVETDFLLALARGKDSLKPRAVAALVDHVPVRPAKHEQAVSTAAVLADEHDCTPFDAVHGGVAITTDEPVLTSEQDYDDVGIDRVPLEPTGE